MAAQSMADNGESRLFRRLLPPALPLAFAGVLAALALLLGSIAIFGRASDGEPSAKLDFNLARPHRTASLRPASGGAGTINPTLPGTGAPAPAASAGAASLGAPPLGAQLPVATPAPPPAKIDKPILAGHALVADPALIEATPDGPLPRIADNGRTPMAAYAPPVPPGAARPRIAIVMSGLGISARETEAALDRLPPQVTLAFAPYADDVQHWVSEARRRGHEVLLEVPMEPYDFPDSDPGPHTLRAAVSEQSNIERLIWCMTRFTGYAGVTNLLGGRFLSDSDSVSPMLTFLARRGLLFFESTSDSRSVASDVARQVSTPYVQSSVAVDAIQTAMEIDARLSELEARARASGSTAGTGFVYPVTIERVTNWASGLPGRGFVLVPASAIVGHSR